MKIRYKALIGTTATILAAFLLQPVDDTGYRAIAEELRVIQSEIPPVPASNEYDVNYLESFEQFSEELRLICSNGNDPRCRQTIVADGLTF